MNKEKKETKKQEGITLVALIITIIVMLILVGVSIRVVVNSGILGIAKNAGNSTKTAYNEESNFGGVITIGGKQYASIEDYRAGNEIVGNTPGGENPEVPPVVPAGTRTTAKSIYTSGGKTAVIPAGFTVSGLDTENTIAGGLVIYLIPEGTTVDWTNATAVATAKTNYDQFVWIPIDNINEMFICQGKPASDAACEITVEDGKAICKKTGHNTTIIENENTIYNNTQMAGRQYAVTEGVFTAVTNQTYASDTGRREPDVITDYDGDEDYLGELRSILGDTGYEAMADFKAILQAEYNEIVKSVYENEGFWVGRYETSGMDNANHTVNITAGTSTGINETTWYSAYAKQKIYISKKRLTGVGSGMILGAMHDQVLKFAETEDYNITEPGNVAHNLGAGAAYQTGGLNYSAGADVAYNDYSKNIYDLEGNVVEWTTEANDLYSRVYRGRLLQQQRFGKLLWHPQTPQ